MTIPASVPVVLALMGFFPYIRLIFNELENMKYATSRAGCP